MSSNGNKVFELSKVANQVIMTQTSLPKSFISRMRQIDIGDSGHALLVRENGAYTAVGHKCTHYGAPLVKGSLVNGLVRCPWHGACFNVHTGDIEDFPGLDNIPKFQVCDNYIYYEQQNFLYIVLIYFQMCISLSN